MSNTNNNAVVSYELLASEKGCFEKAFTSVMTAEGSALDAYIHVAMPVAAWCQANKVKKLSYHVGGAYKAHLQSLGVSESRAKRLVERASHFMNPEHKVYQPGFQAAALKGFDEAKACLAKLGIKMASDLDKKYDISKGGEKTKKEQDAAAYRRAKVALEALPRHVVLKLLKELDLMPSTLRPLAVKPKGKRK